MKVTTPTGDIDLPQGICGISLNEEDIIMILGALDVFEFYAQKRGHSGELISRINKLYWKLVEETDCPFDPKTVEAHGIVAK